MSMAALDRVKLTEDARSRFPDIGSRDGVVQRIDRDKAVIIWRGVPGETTMPMIDLEAA